MSISTMKLALAALETCRIRSVSEWSVEDITPKNVTAAIAALRTAIQQAEAQQPATGEPVKVVPYNPTTEMMFSMKGLDPALSLNHCRELWSVAWKAAPTNHPAPSVPMTMRMIELLADITPEEHHDDNGPGSIDCPACGRRMKMKWRAGKRIDRTEELPHDENCPAEWARAMLAAKEPS